MLTKILFLALSTVIAIISIVSLNKLPNNSFSSKGNYWRISIYSTCGAFVDFVLFWIIVCCTPPGEYGTGIEVVTLCLTLILYGVPCAITSHRLKKRMQKYNNMYNVSRINGLNLSVIFKAMFIFVETIWLIEV